MKIRPCTDTDVDAVVQLWGEAGLTRPWNDPVADAHRKLAVQPELFLVATDKHQLVGSVIAGYDGHRGWIHYLAVADHVRGAGLGKELVRRVEEALRIMGCPKVQLQVRPDNTKVLAFYEHLGYTTYETVSMGKRLVEDGPVSRSE